jgi:hypothetical protein
LEGSKRAKQGWNLTKRGRKGGENDNGYNLFKRACNYNNRWNPGSVARGGIGSITLSREKG